MSLELRHYRMFATVAETGSFTAAARALATSQPAVSRGVAAIERRLGTQLVVRTTRALSLTPAGRTLAAEARHVLDAAAAAESRTIRAANGHSLVLALKPDSATEFVSELIETASTALPGVEVELAFLQTHEIAEAVVRGRCDAGLVAWPITAPGLVTERLWTETRVAVLSADHPLAEKPHLTVEDFFDQPVARWPHLPEYLDRHYQGLDDAPATATGIGGGPAVADLAEALRLVELGRAITFLPESVAARFDRPRLARRRVDRGLAPDSMFLVWASRTGSSEVRRLVDVCRRLAAARP